MAIRDDITVDWEQSPRLIRVAAPSTEISLQDAHDTLRSLEHEPNPGFDVFSHESIIDSAGKEDLGGSLVSITSTLQNARMYFDAIKASSGSGTVTTADATGLRLIDNAASFTTEAAPGAWLVNLDDGSICTVLRVVDDTELVTDGLGDGSTNQFGLGDSYKIWKVIQCEVSGGNVVAVDDVGAELSPVLPTAGTQALVARSSSGTLLEGGTGASAAEIWNAQLAAYAGTSGSTAEALLQLLYEGKICLDPINGIAGTAVLTGTRNIPSNNWADAKTLAERFGYVKIEILNSVTFTATDVINDFTFCGTNAVDVVVTVEDGCETQNTSFHDLEIEGLMDGKIDILHCQVGVLDRFKGHAHDSMFLDDITIEPDARTSVIIDCTGAKEGGALEVNIGGNGLMVVGWRGTIKLTNKTGVSPTIIGLDGGYVEIDTTCIAGLIRVAGEGRLGLDESGPGCTVDSADLLVAKDLHGQVDKIDLAPTIGPAAVEDGSLLDRLANKDSNKTFNQGQDSLEAIRKKVTGT
jgi:hypothetical protein